MVRHIRVELMRHNLIEAILGALVLIMASYFLIFAYSSGNAPIEKGYMLVAKFERIDGLSVGNDVKISGVRVGRIEKIDIDLKSYQAVVVIHLRENIRVSDDSMAEVVSEGLLGGKYIAVVPGSSDQMLAPGGRIVKTLPSVNFETLISNFLFSKEDKKAP